MIADIKITSENCNNISNFSGVSGKVNYDPSTSSQKANITRALASGKKN